MKLQILVPQYKETDTIVKPLLDSLLVQQNVDFNEFSVIIVNDGTDVRLSEDLLKSYPYQIDYYIAPHRGVSATRNTCLDYATADYVMFCDADDMFYNACGLYLIFREIDIGFDSLSSRFIEESVLSDGKHIYINRDNDNTFVHGKVQRRQYLIDNDIRWNPNLTIHEDSYFNVQCAELTDKHKYLKEAFYLWKWRDNSVCRSDSKYILKTFHCLVDSIDALVEKFEKVGKHDKAVYYTVFLLFNAFYTMNKPEWRQQENLEYITTTELRVYQFFDKYRKNWTECSMKTAMEISNAQRTRLISEGMLLEEMTIQDWLAKLDRNYKNKTA